MTVWIKGILLSSTEHPFTGISHSYSDWQKPFFLFVPPYGDFLLNVCTFLPTLVQVRFSVVLTIKISLFDGFYLQQPLLHHFLIALVLGE